MLNTELNGNFYRNFGPRQANTCILHCKLRNRGSNLNYDLFCVHLVPSPVCDCGFISEDADHFLFRCPNFNDQDQYCLTSCIGIIIIWKLSFLAIAVWTEI